MNDYLSTLAARGLNQAPVVQPRLGSIFEPAANQSRPLAESVWGEEERFVEQRISPRESGHRRPTRQSSPTFVPSPTASGASASDALPVRAAQPLDEPSATSQGHIVSPLAPASPPVISQPAVRVETPSIQAAPPAIRHSDPAQPLVDNPSRHDKEFSSRPTHPPGSPVIEPVIQRAEAPRVGLAETDGTGRDTSQLSKPSAQLAEPSVIAPVVPHPQPTQHRTEDYPLASLRQLATKAGPTIQVTIGRVEVRAIVPPAPTPPRPVEAPRGPMLSLEEYLKQRNG